jgi:hypothetical protein
MNDIESLLDPVTNLVAGHFHQDILDHVEMIVVVDATTMLLHEPVGAIETTAEDWDTISQASTVDVDVFDAD